MAHLLYFAMNPFSTLGAFTRPLLMHDKSKCWANSPLIWVSSLISCTLFFRRFLLSTLDLSSSLSPSESRNGEREQKMKHNFPHKLTSQEAVNKSRSSSFDSLPAGSCFRNERSNLCHESHILLRSLLLRRPRDLRSEFMVNLNASVQITLSTHWPLSRNKSQVVAKSEPLWWNKRLYLERINFAFGLLTSLARLIASIAQIRVLLIVSVALDCLFGTSGHKSN